MQIVTNKLIYPYFVRSGKGFKEAIKDFPGVYRYSPDEFLTDISKARELGINKFLLFGIPDNKDVQGSSAYQADNPVTIALRLIKDKFEEVTVITDVCLCMYTTHGHCGILNAKKQIDRIKTLELLSRIALSQAEAGADWIAPSAMAVGQVKAIRKVLDRKGFRRVKIMGYSAKFASNFYEPFRNAADSAPRFGDRKGYQLDYCDTKRALKEIKSDINEGADMVMVKPALAYLDIIKEAKLKFNYSLAAYNTSGEYAFVKLGAKNGLWDERKIVHEIISSIFRAGADFVITYHAKDIARWLK